MTDSVVVEGYARLRDGKKWKTRWLVLRKPSPVADCLVLLVFKDKSDKAQGSKERPSVTLEEICGLEAGQWYEGVAFTLTILCLNQAAILGFDSREALQAWDVRLRHSLGEVHRFSVGVLPGTKLESGPATLHLCNNLLALVRDVPPVIIGHWNLPDLRRYGPVPNGFVFEGGTRCGYWAGVFMLASAESEQISFLFDCIVRGISPTRGPFGLRPLLPDPSASQMNSEDKLDHEAQELEKRLSMLSQRSSTVSSTYCPSAGGDDRSISGSSNTSDNSQSDCSIGSRLALWSEPASNPSENVGHAGVKVAVQSIEKLSISQGGGSRPAAKPPRQLQEIGRQSSSDSGIATGSHSSYSGSFSSYTGSLDITPGEDFGSVFSLPPHLAQDLSLCTCPTVPGHEYQVPTSLRYLYDSPRSLLQEGNVSTSEPSTPTKDTSGLTTESAKGDKSSAMTCEGQPETTERQSVSGHVQGQSEESRKSKSSCEHPDSCNICSSFTSSLKSIVTICSVCGGFKRTSHISATGSVIPAMPDKRLNSKEERRRADPAYEIMERNSEAEEKSKYELMGSCGQQRLLQETEGAAFGFPPDAPHPERPRSEGVTYVNIPVSPTSKKQLNYMELELQEPGPGTRGAVAHLPAQRKSSTKYAQIDITATETAHKVGTQHALGRQEGLHALELRRKGMPH
ncbi:protein Dok-7-like isoform X4 [Mastacembelus armatus]|uniref:protein Dok-7-like isoform X4 n=1 Tax=Mastacembelus armatus TaxID=205130 RepID=UPI000E460450|nr:protein Dok-7-like isoform X4 [Mastacembelus armatus]